MRKKLILAFWAVGSTGAVLFTCGLVLIIFSTRKVNLGILAFIVFGIFSAWEGFKVFRKERNSN